MRTLLALALLTVACDDNNTPCQDSVKLIESSTLLGPQSAFCPHAQHTMKTEQIGLMRSSVKVTCTCKTQ